MLWILLVYAWGMSSPVESVAVVILHYGKPELTARLHAQLLSSDPAQAEHIYVLDNAAPQPYPDAHVRLDENLYWGGALAWAVQEFARRGYERLWFFNNDVYFLTAPPVLHAAYARLAALERTLGTVGVYHPAVEKTPYHPQMRAPASVQYRVASVLDGIAPLIHLGALKRAGGVDIAGNPRGYGVDIITSLRIREAKYSLVVDNHLLVRHLYHSTAKSVDGFLAQASAQQDAYMTARLGENWRGHVERMQHENIDYERF